MIIGWPQKTVAIMSHHISTRTIISEVRLTRSGDLYAQLLTLLMYHINPADKRPLGVDVGHRTTRRVQGITETLDQSKRCRVQGRGWPVVCYAGELSAVPKLVFSQDRNLCSAAMTVEEHHAYSVLRTSRSKGVLCEKKDSWWRRRRRLKTER